MKTTRIKTAENLWGLSFHDSFIIDIRMTGSLEGLEIVFYCPSEGSGRFVEVSFDAVVRLEFETRGNGESEKRPCSVYDIALVDSDERQRWLQRMELLGTPDQDGCRIESRAGYADVLHVIVYCHHNRGWGSREDLPGVSIICRGIRMRDVTADADARGWCRVNPAVIPARSPRTPRQHRRGP